MSLEQFIEATAPKEVNSQWEIPNFLQLDEMQEFAPSMEVQAVEISEVFRDMPELQFENWKELSVEQRIEALNAFETEIAKIEMRPEIPVESENLNPGTFGYFNGEKMVVSENVLTSDSYHDYKEVIDTLLHEGRHAYQDYNLNVRQTEQSDTLVDAWRVNLQKLGYDSVGTFDVMFATKGFYRYYTQPIEVDARYFAETVMNKLGL